IKTMEGYWGNESGDPVKVAQVVLKVADAEAVPAHILLGSDAFHYALQAEQARAADARRWEAVSVSTDMNAEAPVPALPTAGAEEGVHSASLRLGQLNERLSND